MRKLDIIKEMNFYGEVFCFVFAAICLIIAGAACSLLFDPSPHAFDSVAFSYVFLFSAFAVALIALGVNEAKENYFNTKIRLQHKHEMNKYLFAK